jgi:hypothetical protein
VARKKGDKDYTKSEKQLMKSLIRNYSLLFLKYSINLNIFMFFDIIALK